MFRAVSGKERRVMRVVDNRYNAMLKVRILASNYCFSTCDSCTSCIKPSEITS